MIVDYWILGIHVTIDEGEGTLTIAETMLTPFDLGIQDYRPHEDDSERQTTGEAEVTQEQDNSSNLIVAEAQLLTTNGETTNPNTDHNQDQVAMEARRIERQGNDRMRFPVMTDQERAAYLLENDEQLRVATEQMANRLMILGIDTVPAVWVVARHCVSEQRRAHIRGKRGQQNETDTPE